jgi:hypothetical protein
MPRTTRAEVGAMTCFFIGPPGQDGLGYILGYCRLQVMIKLINIQALGFKQSRENTARFQQFLRIPR